MSGTVYTALFLGLAALTRHAVVVGLLFVLVWEGVLGSVFAGVRWLSVGAWGRAVADEVSPRLDDASTIGLAYAVVAAVLVTTGAVWFTGDRLRSFTLRATSSRRHRARALHRHEVPRLADAACGGQRVAGPRRSSGCLSGGGRSGRAP